MVGIDLFAGAGGMSLGAISAGVKVRVAVESNKYASMSYSYNHPDIDVLTEDIRNVSLAGFDSRHDQTIVLGGPPCKGFSTSNQRTRTRANPNNWLYKEYLRIIEQIKPDWAVFENVKGIQETEGGEFLNYIVESLESYGYTISCGVLNACDFGVPQNRSRLFIIGSRHGVKVDLPTPVVSQPVSVIEAIGDLPTLSNGASICKKPYRSIRPSKYAKFLRGEMKESHNHLVTRNADYILERYRYVPPGGNWEDIPTRLMRNYKDRNRCHTGIYHRLHPIEPSKVIGNYRKNMVIHPYEDRGLSVREAARLQSFPDWFVFKGSIGFQQEQVGNAVPPLLAKAVFSAIINKSQ